jgi:hypothetical protein
MTVGCGITARGHRRCAGIARHPGVIGNLMAGSEIIKVGEPDGR